MITIKQLSWSNAFSYGKDNKIDFVAAPLTQLVGKNGHGKSSIALILEEVLFNKNSKGIKKADILNRYIKDKQYNIEVVFERDGVEYEIRSVRGTAQTVKLFKQGVDISAHTATQTYKIIEEVLGFDHKTFAQIVYQSNASSLEFLTAADTARKKFLIEILNLGKYTRAQEVFKEAAQELSKDIAATQSQVNTVKAWLDKYEKTDLTPKPLVGLPTLDDELLQKTGELQQTIQNIEQTNKKISQNNTYKQLQAGIQLMPVTDKPSEDPTIATRSALANKLAIEAKKGLDDSRAFVKKINGLSGTCPTCLQPIDQHKLGDLIAEQQQLQQELSEKYTEAAGTLDELSRQAKVYQAELQLWQQSQKNHENWEKYHQLISSELPEQPLDKQQLQSELNTLQASIQAVREQIAAAEQHNARATAHNSKVDLISKQLLEMQAELETYAGQLHEHNERMSLLGVLTKTFSTTGLVAYKIECLVKDLEEVTNKYLVDLSDGRFQISFKISASDKLNVVITDNGRDIEMAALSGGERARVNVATLLGIRKLMQTLSSSRINLLILDETVETLDIEGKERLVEVLLREEHLNTFLVSHGFTHPLLEKVNVVKRANVSQIEA